MFRFSSPPSHEDGSVRLAKNWENLEGLDQALFIYLFIFLLLWLEREKITPDTFPRFWKTPLQGSVHL